MNKERRERLQTALDSLVEIRDEEQDAFDNLPDSFQQGEQGEKLEEWINTLTEAIDNIEGVE